MLLLDSENNEFPFLTSYIVKMCAMTCHCLSIMGSPHHFFQIVLYNLILLRQSSKLSKWIILGIIVSISFMNSQVTFLVPKLCLSNNLEAHMSIEFILYFILIFIGFNNFVLPLIISNRTFMTLIDQHIVHISSDSSCGIYTTN